MVSIRLDDSLQKEINALSEKNNITKSRVIKDALLHYFDMLKKEKTPYELGAQLFGKYSSKRDDLSTTYKQKIKEKISAKSHN